MEWHDIEDGGTFINNRQNDIGEGWLLRNCVRLMER